MTISVCSEQQAQNGSLWNEKKQLWKCVLLFKFENCYHPPNSEKAENDDHATCFNVGKYTKYKVHVPEQNMLKISGPKQDEARTLQVLGYGWACV